jgi:hypothetical protein
MTMYKTAQVAQVSQTEQGVDKHRLPRGPTHSKGSSVPLSDCRAANTSEVGREGKGTRRTKAGQHIPNKTIRTKHTGVYALENKTNRQ